MDVHLGRTTKTKSRRTCGETSCGAQRRGRRRAVTIDAPIRRVAMAAQIGEDRGGFYSYSLLERAVGAHIHNANASTRSGRTCASATPSGWPGAKARPPGR